MPFWPQAGEASIDLGRRIRLGRIAGASALCAAVLVAAVLIFDPFASAYQVEAYFQNASQLVKGDLVEIGGAQVGHVTDIGVAADGEAQATLAVDSPYAPLRQGSHLTIRSPSLGSVAGRYVEVDPPPGEPPAIRSGGTIGANQTTSAVDLDQIFDTFGPAQRRGLTEIVRGSAAEYRGQGPAANAGLAYLDPAVAATARLFAEVDRDPATLHGFIDDSRRLMGDIATRRASLAALVGHLATTTAAVGSRQSDLSASIAALPAFMRQSNTTFVNLRATLDDLQPLVDRSKPVAVKLQPFLERLRSLTTDAQPTVHRLATLISKPGGGNDLIDLTRATLPLEQIAVGPVRANGAHRRGAFPESARALASSTPELAYARPYAPDLVGWFNDFSHPGVYDALGGISRVGLVANTFLLANGLPDGDVIPPQLRGQQFLKVAQLRQLDRCPGSAERDPGDGSTPYLPYPGYPCDPSEVPLGP